MSLNMFWFLPTHGDGHYLGTEEGSRPVDHSYLQQIAQTADRLGFTGVLIPTGRSCEDAWLVAASMIPVTQRLKFLVALRPSVTSPTVADMKPLLNLLRSGGACCKVKRWISTANMFMSAAQSCFSLPYNNPGHRFISAARLMSHKTLLPSRLISI